MAEDGFYPMADFGTVDFHDLRGTAAKRMDEVWAKKPPERCLGTPPSKPPASTCAKTPTSRRLWA
jgi:hypothetical protein